MSFSSFWGGSFAYMATDDDLVKWDNRPGGKVVDRFTENGVDYVHVEFENSPGNLYLFLA